MGLPGFETLQSVGVKRVSVEPFYVTKYMNRLTLFWPYKVLSRFLCRPYSLKIVKYHAFGVLEN